jgi:hypothetical protein
MKSPAEIANHPKAHLHRELVTRLRASGSVGGAARAWSHLRLNRRLWKRVVAYGLDRPDRQLQLNRIAFPDSNWEQVEAALKAGNKLHSLYELACGNASIARDAAGSYKIGAGGLQIVKHVSSRLGSKIPRRRALRFDRIDRPAPMP